MATATWKQRAIQRAQLILNDLPTDTTDKEKRTVLQQHAPGPPYAPKSFLTVPSEGGKQESLYAEDGSPASMQRDPGSTSAKLFVSAKTGLELMMFVPAAYPF